MFIVTIVQFWIEISDAVLHINIFRSRTLSIITEYFIDQKKYFYFIILYIIIAILIGRFLLVATIFIMFLQYVFVTFKIARYKVKPERKPSKFKCN